jgi:hypothetical protein
VKKIFSILFALVLLVSLGLMTAPPVSAGTIIHVPDDYPTIAAALNASKDGDTIMVAAGEYDAFGVIEKNDISIIGTEGATVTGAIYSPEYGYLMALIEQSENINIKGIDFDGTEVIGGESVFGIIYLDSTGSIADLTVENFIGSSLGRGVAIIDEVGTSTVEITGSTISNNGIGIWVVSESTQEAHLNNIVGNTAYGVGNDGDGTVDATRNWWGDASGPYHESRNPDGMGDEVSQGVDFEPWLGAESVTQTVVNDFLNAIEVADIQVVVNGTATVTVAKYDSNPHPEASVVFGALASLDLLADEAWVEMEDTFRDVCIINYTSGTEIELRLYYTDAEVEAADVDEDTLRLFWWNDIAWVQCSLPPGDSGVNMADITIGSHDYSGYMWAIITEDTTPSLDELQGDEFGGYGHPTPPGGGFCFIATAAYGTDTAEQLDILREFRDEVLLPNSLGAKFVSLYYRTSPPIADFISQHEILRTAVRVGFVDPIVKILTWTHDSWST